MSFKFAVIVPAKGSNKIARFKTWAKENLQDLEFRLPPQVPIEASALTVRVRTLEDRDRLKQAFPETLP